MAHSIKRKQSRQAEAMEAYMTVFHQHWCLAYKEGPFLNAKNLQKLRIECSRLDLNNPHDSTNYVTPVPLEQLRDWIAERDTWSLIYTQEGKGDHSTEHNGWFNARFIKSNINELLLRGKGGSVYEDNVLEKYTQWGTDSDWILQGRRKHWFDIALVLEREKGDLPHTNAIFLQEMELKEDLSAMEIYAMIHLTMGRSNDGMLDRFPVIPITLLSIGECKVRIIHGAFDANTRRLRIKKSRILDFDKPGSQDSNEFLRAMCWLLAPPASTTVKVLN